MNSDLELVERCLKKDPIAQELLYRRFAGRMYGLCLRYVRDKMEADDILQEGFVRVFNNLRQYKGKGSFEGWIRKIFVNTAINHYRGNIKFLNDTETRESEIAGHTVNDAVSKLNMDELLSVVNELPDGYRMVFNLYVIEGYDHGEIGVMLGINDASSRSQLSRARSILQEKLITRYHYPHYERTA